MATPEHFARIRDRVDVNRLLGATVVFVGLGAVGGGVAEQLARSGVGTLILIDGDVLDTENIARHVLGDDFVGVNKAEGMAQWLTSAIPSLRVEFIPRYIDETIPNEELDEILRRADIIVAATDERNVQRRIGRRSLALDVPVVFPGIDEAGDRGEIFVSLGRGRSPCFECWDLFRDAGVALRGVGALAVDILPTVDVTVRICLGLLDPGSDFSALLRGLARDRDPRTLFFVGRPGVEGGMFADGRTFRRAVPDFRENCPACGGAPAGRRRPRALPAIPLTARLARWFPPGPMRWLAISEVFLFILGAFIPSGIIWATFALFGLIIVGALVANSARTT
jgi:molybdopterin/thiamine biosynthesis adenylyltransferase